MIKNFIRLFLSPSTKLYKIFSYIYNYSENGYLPRRIESTEIVLENFSKLQPKISFVQVGSNDGISGDPLNKHIVNYNWHGTVIEPVFFLFEKLKLNYYAFVDRLQFLNVAISAEPGISKTLYSIDEKYIGEISDWHFQLASFYKHILYKHHIPDKYIKQIEVKIKTLQSVIEENMNGYIDVLHIDTEGYDFEILKTLNIVKTTPKIILIEYIHLLVKDRKQLMKLFQNNGYKVYRCDNDFIGIHETIYKKSLEGTTVGSFYDMR